MIEQNHGAVERLGNVEKITFVEGSLASKAGARGTARFDVHVIYERKIDVAAECERLKKGIGEDRERVGATIRSNWGTNSSWPRLPAKVVEGLRTRGAGADRSAGEDNE